MAEVAAGRAHLAGMAADPPQVPGGVFGLDVSFGGQHGMTLSRHSVSVNSICLYTVIVYSRLVPKLWTETLEEHRRAVHDATLDTTAALVREHGLASVTMSQIAVAAGIGRATLYKYFPDVEAILLAWHDRLITGHLRQLAEARDAAATPADRLEAVLEAFALIQYQHHDTELPVALLHRGEHVARARQQLQSLVSDLLAVGAQVGAIRSDIAPDELAGYCLHALTAAGGLPSEPAVRRLLAVTMSGLRPQAR